MSTASDTHFLAPKINIKINGNSLPKEVNPALIEVTVLEDLEAPGMFVIKLVNWDTTNAEITMSDDNLFNVGNAVEVEMGYANNLSSLIFGEITGLEPEFLRDEVPSLLVRGYDLRHRLMRGRKTRSFAKIKDSDIASKIAREEHNLKPQVTDTKVKLDYVLQHNQTDLEFLQSRSQRIGYEVVVENKTLYFRTHQNTQTKVLTLKREDLIEFFPRLSTMNLVNAVEVRSWNAKLKEVFVGKANVGNETTKMGGKTSGPKAVKQAFGQASEIGVDRPVYSQEEADQMAVGQFNDMAIAYIAGEGTCTGNPALRAGKMIEITGIGKRFSGLYYVTSANHTYSFKQGYTTQFTLRRNAT